MTEFKNEINNNEGAGTIARKNSTFFIILGWIFALLSLFIYPFIFGVAGVIMGVLASKRGSRAGLPIIVASIILMGIGLIFSKVIMNYVTHYLGM